MSWTDVVGETQGVLAVFGGEAPPLVGLDVQEMNFTYRGPSIVLSVSLRDYPPDPPPKWAAQGFNTVLLTLYCFDVRDVRLIGWGRQVTADLSFEKSEERVLLRLESPDATLSLSARSIDVQKVSAYLRLDDSEAPG